MSDLQIPKVIEHVTTSTLDKGRVSTEVAWFLINDIIFDDIIRDYLKGERTKIEARIGQSIKHPKDKYNKRAGIETAIKNMKKNKLDIHGIYIQDGIAKMYIDGYIIQKFIKTGNIIVKLDNGGQ